MIFSSLFLELCCGLIGEESRRSNLFDFWIHLNFSFFSSSKHILSSVSIGMGSFLDMFDARNS